MRAKKVIVGVAISAMLISSIKIVLCIITSPQLQILLFRFILEKAN